MPAIKKYKDKREAQDARNARERGLRKISDHSRYVCLTNNYGAKIAKHFLYADICECCGFKRDDYFMELHHVKHTKDSRIEKPHTLFYAAVSREALLISAAYN